MQSPEEMVLNYNDCSICSENKSLNGLKSTGIGKTIINHRIALRSPDRRKWFGHETERHASELMEGFKLLNY